MPARFRIVRTVLLSAVAFSCVSSLSLGCGGASDAAGPRKDFGTKATAFGDSVTLGYNATSEQAKYANIVARKMGWVLKNRALSGTQLADEIPVIYAENVEPHGNSFILTGLNDMRNFGLDNAGMTFFENTLYAALAWLAVSDADKVKGVDANVSYTGTWEINPFYNRIGRHSSEPGATAAFTVTGTTIYIGSTSWYGGRGAFAVSVDGVDKGTWACTSTRRPGSEADLAPFLVRLTGLSAGTHRVVLTVTSQSGYVSFDWAAGIASSRSPGPNVFVGNALRMRPAGYRAESPRWSNGSDAAVESINARIWYVCNELARDGRNVIHVDVSTEYDPMSGDISTLDEIHPSDQGMAKIAAAFLAAIR